MAAFSQKHYREIAATLNRVLQFYGDTQGFRAVVDHLAHTFKRDNPKFKPELFHAAIFGPEGPRES